MQVTLTNLTLHLLVLLPFIPDGQDGFFLSWWSVAICSFSCKVPTAKSPCLHDWVAYERTHFVLLVLFSRFIFSKIVNLWMLSVGLFSGQLYQVLT